MTDQELYRKEVEEQFRELHKIALDNYIHNIIIRFSLAYYSARDCAASIHYALERETRKAEEEVGSGGLP